MEWNRDPEKKFYPPRRKVLKQVVDALQELADDKLDLLAVSLPPGSGKTTLAIFFLTWLGGKIPNDPMLTGSHSNSFVRGVYDECLRIMDRNGDYLWHEVFPDIKSRTQMRRTVVSTSTSVSVLRRWSSHLLVLVMLVCIVRQPCSTVTIWCLVSRWHCQRNVSTSCGRHTPQT